MEENRTPSFDKTYPFNLIRKQNHVVLEFLSWKKGINKTGYFLKKQLQPTVFCYLHTYKMGKVGGVIGD